MIAVAIMSVGATGLLALQSANTIANAQAQNMSRATAANQLWAQRLRRDALEWRDATPSGLGATEYLGDLALLGVDGDTGWFVPPASTDSDFMKSQSFGFDFRGREVALDGSEGAVAFCTNLRLRWALDQNAVRADVRTWWHRLTPSGSQQQVDYQATTCAEGTADAATTALREAKQLRAVYTTILLRPAPL